MNNGSFVWRLIGVLLLIGLVTAGGFMAYRAGLAQGIAQAPEVAAAISQAAESGQAAPIPPMMYGRGYGYGYGFGHPHLVGFFPFWICGSILFIFVFFGLLRMAFRPWSWRHHGPWGKWEGGAPPIFNEWHKRAHEEKPDEKE